MIRSMQSTLETALFSCDYLGPVAAALVPSPPSLDESVVPMWTPGIPDALEASFAGSFGAGAELCRCARARIRTSFRGTVG